MDPLEPAVVRRLGDKRRTQRRASIAIAASVLAVIGALIPVTLARTDEGATPVPPAVTPSPEPSTTPTPTATPTVVEPSQMYTFDGEGSVLRTPEDIDRLDGLSAPFRSFLNGLLERAIQATDPCDDNGNTGRVVLRRYHTSGYALGAVSGCGTGHNAVWAIVGSWWQEVAASGDRFLCTDLDKHDIPHSLVPDDLYGGGCDEPFGPTTVQGLRLGMTAEEARAAGASATYASGGCTPVALPDLANGFGPIATAVLSPTKGIVTFFAEPGAKTPEYIALGSTRSQVEAAYPNGSFDETHGVGWFR